MDVEGHSKKTHRAVVGTSCPPLPVSSLQSDTHQSWLWQGVPPSSICHMPGCSRSLESDNSLQLMEFVAIHSIFIYWSQCNLMLGAPPETLLSLQQSRCMVFFALLFSCNDFRRRGTKAKKAGCRDRMYAISLVSIQDPSTSSSAWQCLLRYLWLLNQFNTEVAANSNTEPCHLPGLGWDKVKNAMVISRIKTVSGSGGKH